MAQPASIATAHDTDSGWTMTAFHALGSRSWWLCVLAIGCNQLGTMLLNQAAQPS